MVVLFVVVWLLVVVNSVVYFFLFCIHVITVARIAVGLCLSLMLFVGYSLGFKLFVLCLLL